MKLLTHPTAPHFAPSEEEIQHTAYLLWQAEGRPVGRDLGLWLRAKEALCHRQTHRPPGVPSTDAPLDDELPLREKPADRDPL